MREPAEALLRAPRRAAELRDVRRGPALGSPRETAERLRPRGRAGPRGHGVAPGHGRRGRRRPRRRGARGPGRGAQGIPRRGRQRQSPRLVADAAPRGVGRHGIVGGRGALPGRRGAPRPREAHGAVVGARADRARDRGTGKAPRARGGDPGAGRRGPGGQGALGEPAARLLPRVPQGPRHEVLRRAEDVAAFGRARALRPRVVRRRDRGRRPRGLGRRRRRARRGRHRAAAGGPGEPPGRAREHARRRGRGEQAPDAQGRRGEAGQDRRRRGLHRVAGAARAARDSGPRALRRFAVVPRHAREPPHRLQKGLRCPDAEPRRQGEDAHGAAARRRRGRL